MKTFFLWPAVNVQSPWLSSVTSVSGAQNLNNPWIWYSHNIPPMIKMSNSYFTQRGAQDSDLGVMIGRCSLDSQHGWPIVILRMLAVLFSATQITTRWTPPTRDPNGKYGLGKTTNLHYTAILRVTLHKEDTGKEWGRYGKNFLFFRQLVRDSLIELER